MRRTKRGFWGPLRLVLFTVLLLGMLPVRANVTHNVTFTVKSDGTVVAQTDIGVFDAMGNTLTISPSDFPESFKNTSTVNSTKYADLTVTPVGFNMTSSLLKDIGSFRILSLRHYSAVSANWSSINKYGTCDGGTTTSMRDLIISTHGKDISMVCTSNRMHHSYATPHYYFYPQSYTFRFFENEGGSGHLADRKISPGVYTFPTYTFSVSQMLPSGADVVSTKAWSVRIRIIVEPSMETVNMPATLPLDVREEGNMLVGSGSVLAQVNGTFGRHLRIEPRLGSGGNLVKGGERIPYTLDVTALAGDFSRHRLVDGVQGTATPALIPLHGIPFEFPLRFDAAFRVPKSNLSSGLFSERITLVFSSTDV